MTFSPTSSRRRSLRGFTLIEIMLVVALIAIIFVGVAPVIGASNREKRLRAAAEEIGEMVRSERARAQSSGERRVLEVRGTGFHEKSARSPQLLPMPKVASVRFRAAGSEQWEKPGGQEWEFSPIGLVTPWSVRLQDGNAWMEVDYDLLTGRVAEERYAF